jgi:hypothetical protein
MKNDPIKNIEGKVDNNVDFNCDVACRISEHTAIQGFDSADYTRA